MKLKWWEYSFTMRKVEGSLATHATGPEKAVPLMIGLSVGLLSVGVYAPFVQVSKLFIFQEQVSVLSGIRDLWVSGEHLLAVVILVFSIIFPFYKLLSLDAVWRGYSADSEKVAKGLKRLEWLGKWSMLDVLVAGLLVVSVKASIVGDVQSQPGLYFFFASVVLAMMTAALANRTVRRIQSQEASDVQPLS